MFSLFKKKEKNEQKPPSGIPPHLLELRKTLFSTTSLDPFLEGIADLETVRLEFPWSNFFDANQALKNNDQITAISLLRQVAETPDLETRMYLQAWHTLISLGEIPPESLRGVIQGVVCEYRIKEHGLDIVAAYKDHRARYWNQSGIGVIWEARDPEIDGNIDHLLEVGQAIADTLGVGVAEPPDIPELNMFRVYMMTFNGSCFGRGTWEEMEHGVMGRVSIRASYDLMKSLMDRGEQKLEKIGVLTLSSRQEKINTIELMKKQDIYYKQVIASLPDS